MVRPAGLLALLVVTAAVGQDAPPAPRTTKAQRDKLLALDTAPPAKKRKLPAPTVPAFDWVDLLGPTPIHAQGGKPNCVAQATVAALEWNWQVRNNTPQKPLLSPQPMMDRLQKAGSLLYVNALDQLLLHGTAPLADYPYTGTPQKPGKASTPYRLVGWGRLGGKGPPSIPEVKAALLEHGPLVVGIHSTPAFRRYKGGVFAEYPKDIPAGDPTNHAVVLLGWDDRRGKGCWHVQNSWGLRWGEGGGAWVEYGSNNVAHFAYWVKAQGSRQPLPADAHAVFGELASPFPRKPGVTD